VLSGDRRGGHHMEDPRPTGSQHGGGMILLVEHGDLDE